MMVHQGGFAGAGRPRQQVAAAVGDAVRRVPAEQGMLIQSPDQCPF